MSYIRRAKMTNDFTVVQDKREKNPWKLPWPTEIEHLKVGDYAFKEYRDSKGNSPVAIEKKQDLVEILNDLTARYRPTFKRFLAKMSRVPVKCIIVGEPLDTERVRRAIKIVKKKSNGRSQLTERTLWHWTGRIVAEYGVPILYVKKHDLDRVLREVFESSWKRVQEL